MDPSLRKTAEEIQAESNQGGFSTRITVCPQCGHPRFYATNTYYLIDGTKRRLRKCFACGHARSEMVPRPILDGDDNGDMGTT